MRAVWLIVALVIAWAAPPSWAADRPLETADDAYRALTRGVEDLTNAEKERMRDLIEAARDRSPGEVRWRLAEVLLAEQTGQLRSAAGLAEEIYEEHPDNAVAAYALAVARFETLDDVPQIEKGEATERVARLLERAVELDPTLYPARQKLIGYLLRAPPFAGGDPDRARSLALEMLRIEGQEHLGHLNAALVEAERKNWPAMESHFEQAVSLAPDAAFQKRAMFSRAWAHFDKREDYRVAAMIGRFCADGPFADDFRFHFIAAESLRNLGDWDQALVYYDQVLALQENAPVSMIGRARCLDRLGREAEAIEAYRAYLDTHGVSGPTDELGLEAERALQRLEADD